MVETTAIADQVSDVELARYAKVIYEKTGIRISPQKKTLLSNRIRRRLRQTGITDFNAYLQHLTRRSASDPEWDAFLQEITTHETYLFRDDAHWAWFRNLFLPEVAAERKSAGFPSLRIWSAACSTGDEAATIACCIAGCLPDHERWKIQIIGTDIGVGAIAEAAQAVFGERAMKLVPDDFKRRFFTKASGANVWQAKPALTKMMSFRQHNLLEAMKGPAFDVVFLKNVLIYFDPASKAAAVKHVLPTIRVGGYLVAGAAEGISDLLKDLERIHPWLYRKKN